MTCDKVLGQNSCQPVRVAARIGAGRVARLAKVLDIRCTERLAITNSGSNAHVFHYVRHSKSSGAVLPVLLLRIICVAAGLLYNAASTAQQIALSIGRIEGPSFTATKIAGALRAADAVALDLRLGEVTVAGNSWHDMRMRCPELRQEHDQLLCAQGTLETPTKTPFSFRYSTLAKNLDLALKPAAGEEWRLMLESQAASRTSRTFTLAVSNGLLTRLAPWWPASLPKPNAGSVSGRLALTDEDNAQASAELNFSDFGFGDESGLHAGEKIAVTLSLQAQQRGDQWQWQSRTEWKSGDVFWQPLFVSGAGHVLSAAGVLDAKRILFERGRLTLAGVGDIDFSGTLDRVAGQVATASVKTVDIGVAALYEKVLKAMLQGTVLGDLRSDGRVDIALEIKNGAVAVTDLTFRRLSVEDKMRRFALFGLSGRLPWNREQPTSARLQLDGGEVLQMPFGAFELPLEMRGIGVRMRDVQIPVLDGKLLVNDFDATSMGENWRWRFSGGIAPISMERFTTELGLPVMHGTLSATIPAVSYQQSTLKIDGALLFKVFDGTIAAQNLVLEDPLGKVPRLTTDVDMRNLDLDLLTRTFSFGNITGRVDAQVREIELVNWEAVQFDARVASSAGEYPKRISQAAVQNISALGGAGAASAIQRSFLRFFETFGYSALGLSCKLESGVCQMGGIENVPQGYVIVKGGGIPAINVLGYNRSVGWHELIERLKRVTEGNVIVK